MKTSPLRHLPLAQKHTTNSTQPIAKSLQGSAIAIILFLFTFTAQAMTLSEAVNAQLESISGPCEKLLNAGGVPTGGLAAICGRFVPANSPTQANTGSSANLSTLSSNTKVSNREAQVQEQTQLAPQWTLFITGEKQTLNHDLTDGEDGYNSTASRLLGGITYAWDAKTNFGLALSRQSHKGDYDSGGDFDAQAKGARVTASRQLTDAWFIQAAAGYDWIGTQRSRSARFEEYISGVLSLSAQGTPSADFNYHQSEMTLLTGYEFTFNNISLLPQLGLTWLNIDYGKYSESGDSGLELTYYNDKRQSIKSSIGVQATMTHGTAYGVLIPELAISLINEYADKSRNVRFSFTHDSAAKQFSFDTEAGDRSYAEIAAGVSMVLPHGKQLFLRGQTQVNHDHYDSRTVNLGINIEL